ncbi:MAG: ChbG/HpnK family deacetylase [Saprospiraceae bacterium]|nr:ChbG/HpnK family deacetylase [Saprospiraceae bacterium]
MIENSTTKYIITADDLGMSPGINWSISRALEEELITNASIIANGDCFEAAVSNVISVHKNGTYGLHFNLEYGKPVSPPESVSHLLNSKGELCLSFARLMRRTLVGNKEVYAREIKTELRAQISKLEQRNIEIKYIDSHRHIHAVPFVNKIVKNIAREKGISQIRSYNESYIKTFIQVRSLSLLNPLKVIKYLLFKFFDFRNNSPRSSYFFSILLSSALMPEFAKRLSFDSGFKSVEIMVHLGNPELDKHFITSNAIVNRFIKDPKRLSEYEFLIKLKKVFSK